METNNSDRQYLVIISLLIGLGTAYGQSVMDERTVSWTGFYMGPNAGYLFADNSHLNVNTTNISIAGHGPADLPFALASATSGTTSFSLNNNGFIGGGQVGYINTIYSQFVIGLEADIQGIASESKNHGSSNSTSTVNFSDLPEWNVPSMINVSNDVDYLGTVRGRLGYLMTPTLVLSGTGGLAYGGVNSKTSIAQSTNLANYLGIASNWGTAGTYSTTLVGWSLGGNLEWLFDQNWSVKTEYLYYDLGNVTYRSGTLSDTYGPNYDITGAIFTNRVKTTTYFNGQLVRMGVNYHFN